MADSDDVEREVAFAALGGWEKTFTAALERYCEHCRRIPASELRRLPRVLLDFDLWADPKDAVRGTPLGALTLEAAARLLSERVQRGNSDPYAILGTLARECEK